MQIRSLAVISLLFSFAPSLPAQPKRPIAIDDIYRTQQVDNPQCSPDGKWIAYTVTVIDREADKRRTSLWMVNWEGTRTVQLTSGTDGDSSPRWSPDGKYLSFLSARPAGAKKQIWLLDRQGGEARPLTNVKDDIGGYAWSPDSSKIVLEMSAAEDDASLGKPSGTADSAKAPKPIVISRFHFKQDVEGYLTATSRSQLYLFDVNAKKLDPLTTDKNFDDSHPAWSPDSKRIAFVSNHEKDPDQSGADDIFVIEARPGSSANKSISVNSTGGPAPRVESRRQAHRLPRRFGAQIRRLQDERPRRRARRRRFPARAHRKIRSRRFLTRIHARQFRYHFSRRRRSPRISRENFRLRRPRWTRW